MKFEDNSPTNRLSKMAEYVILYTHQKQKKAKIWQDGFLKVPPGQKKGGLYDDKNNKIDTIFIQNGEVSVGDEVETDRYLVQIESIKTPQNAASAIDTVQTNEGQLKKNNNAVLSSMSAIPGRQTGYKQAPRFVGLKRKKTGFNPPRQVKPKVEESQNVEVSRNQVTTALSHRQNFQVPCQTSETTIRPSPDSVHAFMSNPKENVSLNEFLNVKKKEQSIHGNSSSPWSIVGRTKLKSFQIPKSNCRQAESEALGSGVGVKVEHCGSSGSNVCFDDGNVIKVGEQQNNSQNDVAQNEVCLGMTTRFSADNEHFGGHKLYEKRSTSQILALISDNKDVMKEINSLDKGKTSISSGGREQYGVQKSESLLVCTAGEKYGKINSFSEVSNLIVEEKCSGIDNIENCQLVKSASLHSTDRKVNGSSSEVHNRLNFFVESPIENKCIPNVSSRQSPVVQSPFAHSERKINNSLYADSGNIATSEHNFESENLDPSTWSDFGENPSQDIDSSEKRIESTRGTQQADGNDDVIDRFWVQNKLLTGSGFKEDILKRTVGSLSDTASISGKLEKDISHAKCIDAKNEMDKAISNGNVDKNFQKGKGKTNSLKLDKNESIDRTTEVSCDRITDSANTINTGDNNTDSEAACFDINFSPFSDTSLSDYETVACVENMSDNEWGKGTDLIKDKASCLEGELDTDLCNGGGNENNIRADVVKLCTKANSEHFSSRESVSFDNTMEDNCNSIHQTVSDESILNNVPYKVPAGETDSMEEVLNEWNKGDNGCVSMKQKCQQNSPDIKCGKINSEVISVPGQIEISGTIGKVSETDINREADKPGYGKLKTCNMNIKLPRDKLCEKDQSNDVKVTHKSNCSVPLNNKIMSSVETMALHVRGDLIGDIVPKNVKMTSGEITGSSDQFKLSVGHVTDVTVTSALQLETVLNHSMLENHVPDTAMVSASAMKLTSPHSVSGNSVSHSIVVSSSEITRNSNHSIPVPTVTDSGNAAITLHSDHPEKEDNLCDNLGACGNTNDKDNTMFRLSGFDISPDDPDDRYDTTQESLSNVMFTESKKQQLPETKFSRCVGPEHQSDQRGMDSSDDDMTEDEIKSKRLHLSTGHNQKKLNSLNCREYGSTDRNIKKLNSLNCREYSSTDRNINTFENPNAPPPEKNEMSETSKTIISQSSLSHLSDDGKSGKVFNNVPEGRITTDEDVMSSKLQMQDCSTVISNNTEETMSVNNKKPMLTQNFASWDEASDHWRSQTDSCKTSDTMFTYSNDTQSEDSLQDQVTGESPGIMGNPVTQSGVRSHVRRHCGTDGMYTESGTLLEKDDGKRMVRNDDGSYNTAPNLEPRVHCKPSYTVPRHGLLPHPSELMGKATAKVTTDDSHQSEDPNKDLIQKAADKLKSYTVMGSVSSCTVKRLGSETMENVHYTACGEATSDCMPSVERHTNVGSKLKDMEIPHTPDLHWPVCADSIENSLYYFNPEENVKKMFNHKNLFMVTADDVFKETPAEVTERLSPIQSLQCVPEKLDCDVKDKTLPQLTMFESRIHRQRLREPLKCQPFEDDATGLTSSDQWRQFDKDAEKTDRRLDGITTPRQKLPVWMCQSPEDLSFTLSPYPVSFTHHNQPSNTHISLLGLDTDSQEISKPGENNQQLPRKSDGVEPNRMNYESTYGNKTQRFIDNSSSSGHTIQPLQHWDMTQGAGDKLTKRKTDCSNSGFSSRWNRFKNDSQEIKQDRVYREKASAGEHLEHNVPNNEFKHSFQDPVTRERSPLSSSILNTNVLSKSDAVVTLRTNIPSIKSGVDHLVSSSPAIKTEIDLTSDVSTDNDSFFVADFDIETPQRESETFRNIASKTILGSSTQDQTCPQLNDFSLNDTNKGSITHKMSLSVNHTMMNQEFCDDVNIIENRVEELAEIRSSLAIDTKDNVVKCRNMYRNPINRPSVSDDSPGSRQNPLELCSLDVQQTVGLKRGFKPPRACGTGNVRTSAGSRGFTVPLSQVAGNSVVPSTQRNLCGELQFPGKIEAEGNVLPCRQISIPINFSSVGVYKQTLKQVLQEHLNVQLFELSKRYHSALSRVDLSAYRTLNTGCSGSGTMCGTSQSNNPPCEHGQPSKIVQVKKEGRNKGRYFFACNNARTNQCKFFKWADETPTSGKNGDTSSAITGSQVGGGCSLALTDGASIGTFLKGQGLRVYYESVFVKKVPDSYNRSQRKNIPAWVKNRKFGEMETQKKIYIRLSRREASSLFAKDDLWVISQQLTFDPSCTFVAKSVFYGPSTSNEVEIQPIAGFHPSNWQNEGSCHALHALNVSGELMCLSTLQDFVNPTYLPVLPALLSRQTGSGSGSLHTPKSRAMYYGPWENILDLAHQLVQEHNLNDFQAEALIKVACMFQVEGPGNASAVTLIHGVFGAGKSFLLAVIVKLIVKLSELRDLYTPGVPEPCKVLISSTTNVAVDRILLGLLNMEFDQFVRVGSVKKIAKPILPYSMHATGTDSQEMKELQDMMKSDICASERIHVKKRLDQLRKGENKRQLEQVRVVGATCAACPFPSLKGLCFSVVILDECSQITEPASLLPIARFGCEKVVLVGDPKQLAPTIEGSEAAHQHGLEQTLFDRLIQMGHKATMLRVQYRCHPWISAVANHLFYNGQLYDGIQEQDRAPLLPELPTLCFYDVPDGRETCEKGGSFCNQAEAEFVARLIETLVTRGVEASDIGVITLYRAQQGKIALLLRESSITDVSELKSIQISTVDAFQGGERNIIILSCVRTNSSGFIDNDKRTNVALTRSRHHLLIVGCRRNLSRNKLWAKVLNHCADSLGGMSTAERFKQEYMDPSEKPELRFPPESSMSREYNSRNKQALDMNRPDVGFGNREDHSEDVDSFKADPTPFDAYSEQSRSPEHKTKRRKLPKISHAVLNDSDKGESSDSEDLPIGL